LPSQARTELGTDPDRTALRILELRAYQRTKAAIDSAERPMDMPTGPLADLVQEIGVDRWRARKAQRGG
jgi:hypothetical protein